MQRAATGYDLPPVRRYDDYDDMQEGGRGKKAAMWILGGLLVVGAAALIGYLLVGGAGNNSGQITVPDVVGQTQEAATTEIEDLGLKAKVQTQFSDEAKGNVVKSDPEADAEVEPGSTVTLFVSKGREEVKVPQLVGLSKDRAEQALEEADLKVGDISERNSSKPRGTVISCSPDEGEDVAAGSEVDLVVSKGGTQVPDVTGLPSQEAEAQIRAAGFRPVVRLVDSPGDEPNTVIEQNPSGGRTAPQNAPITLTVARAQEPVPPPPTETTPPPTSPTPPPTDEPPPGGGG
jgi:beta-lactam-binding protein with PASTA domain